MSNEERDTIMNFINKKDDKYMSMCEMQAIVKMIYEVHEVLVPKKEEKKQTNAAEIFEGFISNNIIITRNSKINHWVLRSIIPICYELRACIIEWAAKELKVNERDIDFVIDDEIEKPFVRGDKTENGMTVLRQEVIYFMGKVPELEKLVGSKWMDTEDKIVNFVQGLAEENKNGIS